MGAPNQMTHFSLKQNIQKTVCLHIYSLCACVLQGYQGLVDGGDHICLATWESVSMMLQLVSDGLNTETHNTRSLRGLKLCF